jgi:hypothetical protein
MRVEKIAAQVDTVKGRPHRRREDGRLLLACQRQRVSSIESVEGTATPQALVLAGFAGPELL